jgi:hypothetical protein
MNQEMIEEEIFQRFKESLIAFGKRTGLIVGLSLIERTIKFQMRDMYKEATGVAIMDDNLPKVPDDLAYEMTNRFITEMDYVKYYDTKKYANQKDQDAIFEAAKALVKQNVIENKVMILFKNHVYVDKLVAVLIKLNS